MTALAEKLINRPAANLYEAASETSTRLRENLPGFLVFNVLERSPGWVRVSAGGATAGASTTGWLREQDVIFWPHNLALRFAHEGKGNRLPVPFFGTEQQVGNVLRLDAPAREGIVRSASGEPDRSAAESAGVTAVQPRLISRRDFYVLPILEHREITPASFPALKGESRLVRVAAMSQTGAPSSAAAPPAGGASAKPEIDLVFVMDLTSSMQPFVDGTLDAVRSMAGSLESSGSASRIRFGFWGYRDSAPDQPFPGGGVTKLFTPLLQDRAAFEQTLAGVKVSESSAGDYAEAVFNGVADAIGKTPWTPGAMRVIILIGDASAHPAGHPKNPGNLSEGTLRDLANRSEKPVYILPIYIERESPLAAPDFAAAEGQFEKLGMNPNFQSGRGFVKIPREKSGADFSGQIGNALGVFAQQLAAEGARLAPPSAPVTASGADPDAADLARSIFAGAYLDWLAARPDAGATAVGEDIGGWACDKDLVTPDVQSLEVVFLINKSQLDTLVKLLNQVIDAGVRSRVRGTAFFSSLQSIVGRAAVNPAQLSAGSSVADLQMVPDFLKALPYRSELLGLTQDEWRGMSAQDQAAFLDRLNSNIAFYSDLVRDPSKWRPLNPEDERDAHVAAIPLERLP